MERTRTIYNFLNLYNFQCPPNNNLCSNILHTIFIPTQETNEALTELWIAEIYKNRKKFSDLDRGVIDLVFLRFKHKAERLLKS